MGDENIIGSGVGQASDFFSDAPSYEENEDFLDDDFEYERFLKIPNATPEKIKALHEAHKERRKKK